MAGYFAHPCTHQIVVMHFEPLSGPETSTRRALLPPSEQVTPTATPAKRKDVRPTPPRPTGAIPRSIPGPSQPRATTAAQSSLVSDSKTILNL